jgi:hypothetical protein
MINRRPSPCLAATPDKIPRRGCSTRLAIMAKRAVQVRECDRCGKQPANTWVITGPDGAPREIELCDQHGSPIANAYALARPVGRKMPRDASARPGNRRPEGTAADAVEPEPIWR